MPPLYPLALVCVTFTRIRSSFLLFRYKKKIERKKETGQRTEAGGCLINSHLAALFGVE